MTRALRTAAAQAILARAAIGAADLQAALVDVEAEAAAPYRAELGWALDLLDDYDVHLLEHGDNPMEAYSEHGIERKRKIRQMLDQEH